VLKASLLGYQPSASLPYSRTGRLFMATVSKDPRMGMAGAGVAPHPIAAAIALLLMAILGAWKPMQVGSRGDSRRGGSKKIKGGRGLPMPFDIFTPVVTAWEILTFVESITRLSADEVWRQIKEKDGYERMRNCKDGNPSITPECAEAWREFERIRSQLLQKLNQLKSGKALIYPKLLETANELYQGGKDGIGYLKALAKVMKCFGCKGA
jgi:hypothetical protein